MSMLRSLLAAAFALIALGGVAACKEQPPEVPGESDVPVASVRIEAMDAGASLALPHDVLFDRLGMRPGSLIEPDRTWSPFREAEDRRHLHRA